jgi:hypothetical protein
MKSEAGNCTIPLLLICFVLVVLGGIVVLGVAANFCAAGVWEGFICGLVP